MRALSKPLAVTVGDPAGVGPDVVVDAWLRRDQDGSAPFYVLSDPATLAARAKLLGRDLPLEVVDATNAAASFSAALPVVPLENVFSGAVGASDPSNSHGIVEAIDRAVRDVMDGVAAAMVTGPIAKKSLYDSGFAFPGHTEYLAHLAQLHTGVPVMPVMMLAGPQLRAVPVTIHIRLADIMHALTRDLILKTIVITARDLEGRFGIPNPRIAVSGLNPHAGENGTMGREEIDTIAPAITEARSLGIEAFGPLPADTMFHAEARDTYDAAVCMYHDQALIPAKALAFDSTVNVTLGLPFIRTSPDHGTAFALAGTGKARSGAFVAALALARDLAGQQGQ